MLRAHSDELFWVLGLFIAVVFTAALVNRFRPAQRPRLRRLVTVFALFATATLTGVGFAAANLPSWSAGMLVAAQILQAFTLVGLTATLLFAILLPGIGIVLPLIASDLLVGIAYVVVTLAILARHGVNPTGALVSGAVLSAVLVISLQSTLGNLIGGVALQLDGSIREGDWIQLENGKQGRVRSVRWRHTVLEARDWSTLIVPNAQLLANQITILGKRDGRDVPQRMAVQFHVDFRYPPSRVVRVATEGLQRSAIPNVADEPRPFVVCVDFPRDIKDGFASYSARYWIRDLASDDPTGSRVRARIFMALQRAQIPLAQSLTGFADMNDEATRQRIGQRLEDRLAALKSVTLFRSLTDDELRTLASGMAHVMYSDGELITRQGAPGEWLYIMIAGTAEIHARIEPEAAARQPRVELPSAVSLPAIDVPAPPFGGAAGRGAPTVDVRTGEPVGHRVRIAQLTAPDFFGEMSLMTGEPRAADVIATGDVECFRLGKETFKTVLLGRPEIATELSAKLASRRVELAAAHGELEEFAGEREASERARILGGIRSFFALD